MLLKYEFKTRKSLREVELPSADQLVSVDIGSKAVFLLKNLNFLPIIPFLQKIAIL
jgi:hypothetical protein